MEEYLITARSVTHAQRMAQVLERRGKGCGYVLRLWGRPRMEAALRLLWEAGFVPTQVFRRRDDGYEEVEV